MARGLHIRQMIGRGLLAVALVAAGHAVAAAQDDEGSDVSARETEVRKLGGSTRFSKPIRTVDELRSMAIINRDNFTRVLAMTGLSHISGAVVGALSAGSVTETVVAPGARMKWMALKRSGTPDVLRNVRWAGRQPFDAWQFSVTQGGMSYTFVVPKICGNMSLVSENAVAVAVAAAPVPPVPTPEPPPAAPAPEPAPVAVAPPPLPPQLPTPTVFVANDTFRWMASGFVGGQFGTNVDEPENTEAGDSLSWGGQVSYAWRYLGAEALFDFAPNVRIANANVAFDDDPHVNSYMANAIGLLPLRAGDFTPYLSGGLGAIQMHADIFPFPLLSSTVEATNETRFGGNLGFGLMAFTGRFGFRTDVRYYKASTAFEPTEADDLADSLAEARTERLLSGLQYWRANFGLALRW